MLNLTFKAKELFNESTNQFVTLPSCEIKMEHSLFVLSKWEAKYKKPFLSQQEKHKKTNDEMIDYFRMMCVCSPEVDIFPFFDEEEVKLIADYINDKQTATWFNDANKPKSHSNRIITSELIYYWLSALQLDWEVQHWPLNRMLTLVEIANIEQQPKKKNKMPKSSMYAQRRALNEQRRAMNGSNG